MKLKSPHGWFAAGQEVSRAIERLSDGAFKLYMHLCLHADRDTGCLISNSHDLVRAIKKSRRSIITYFEELRRQGVCRIESALNQHQRGEIEICDAFWPYHKAAPTTESTEVAGYVSQIREMLVARRCVEIAFTPADEKLAATLSTEQVPLEQIERAIWLGCARKYVALLNGNRSAPITSLHYFQGPIEEVRQAQVAPDYWRYLKLRLERLEAQWLEKPIAAACANFSQADRENRETK